VCRKKERGKMMYHNNFVSVIKSKGKVLREDGNGIVRLPFGSEYTILLKNKDSRKAVVNVEIDDESVAGAIIVPANKTVELKGSLNDLKVRNKFKFIQKTKEIQDYRGDRLGDGLVRVEYKFEKKVAEPVRCYTPPVTIWPNRCKTKRSDSVWPHTYDSPSTGDCTYTYSNSAGIPRGTLTMSNSVECSALPKSDEGITVKGSKTRQDFVYGYTNELESQSSVIILHLRGLTKQRTKVKRAITVKTKLRCPTCGRRSKSSMQYCGNCGTYL
jgi:hypothetical protein